MSPDQAPRLTSEALGNATLAELDTAIGKPLPSWRPTRSSWKGRQVLPEGIVVVSNYKAEGLNLDRRSDPLAVVPGLGSSASSNRSTTAKATSC
jgi:hypothetical protein